MAVQELILRVPQKHVSFADTTGFSHGCTPPGVRSISRCGGLDIGLRAVRGTLSIPSVPTREPRGPVIEPHPRRQSHQVVTGTENHGRPICDPQNGALFPAGETLLGRVPGQHRLGGADTADPSDLLRMVSVPRENLVYVVFGTQPHAALRIKKASRYTALRS